ncbi:MAG: tetratricopeptide repeat protein [Planctomycetota bacterium]
MNINKRPTLFKSLSWNDQNPVAQGSSQTTTRLNQLLVELLQANAGENRISAQHLIYANPDLDPESAVQLIYEEICLKQDEGIAIDSKEILRTFPQYHLQLAALLGFERLLHSGRSEPLFPNPGELIGPFQLIQRLGQGASGRTYLAQEQSLADRLVVIKIMPDDHDEHLALARLQHTNIMPLYSERVIADRGLRLLCMPYLGGSGFDQVQSRLKAKAIQNLTGRDILAAIDDNRVTLSQSPEVKSPSRLFLEQSSYPDAIAFIGASLADAAHEAHCRGLVHMDIKPSNVLISADAQPLLLDFHLARKPIRKNEQFVDRLGGTNGWMSPEQDRCFQVVQRGQPAPCNIDGRSDIYSIGLMLANALRIEPDPNNNNIRLKPGITVGLLDIILKCLALNPNDRYNNAALLAEDLRRHLTNQPLKGVRNRNLVERWHKWQTRNPSGRVWLGATMIFIPLALASGIMAYQIHRQASSAINTGLTDSRKLLKAGESDLALQRLNQLKVDILNYPGLNSTRERIDSEIASAKRMKLAARLNRLVELIRLQSGGSELNKGQIKSLKDQCQIIWDKQSELLQKLDLGDPEESLQIDTQIRSDLESLAIILADLTSQSDTIESRIKAKALLDQAETIFGQTFAITLASQSLSITNPENCQIRLNSVHAKPKNASEYNQLGRFEMAHKHFTKAKEPLRKAISLDPTQFWFHYDLARNTHQIQEYEEALAEWSAAIALKPDSSAIYYNRGLTWEKLRLPQLALLDFNRSLELEPDLSQASFQQGLMRMKTGKTLTAIDSFNHASEKATTPEFKASVLFHLALTYKETGQDQLAISTASQSAKLGSIDAINWLRKNGP